MLIQQALHSMVVPDIAKPPVQLGKEDQIHLAILDIMQQPAHSGSGAHRLSGTDILTSAAIGIVSGLAATGVNQTIRQMTGK